ncbi:hypothetical protein B0H13DRAFT_1888592 [Mycena leptocephala]|nr:hypothetical protein B0H13DRAFT_1888592 [Mycena leptocephala]
MLAINGILSQTQMIFQTEISPSAFIVSDNAENSVRFMDGIPPIIPLSRWLRMGVTSSRMHKLIVLISAVNENLPDDISVVQMHNAQRAAHEAAFYASMSGFRWDGGRLLGPVHFTRDG